MIPSPIMVQVMIETRYPNDILRLIEIYATMPKPQNIVETMGLNKVLMYMADVEEEYQNLKYRPK